jgi:hypothetical protein
MVRVKIVLDADVLIHFSKAGCLSLLPNILPEYECIVLDYVYEEIITIQKQSDKLFEKYYFRKIQRIRRYVERICYT